MSRREAFAGVSPSDRYRIRNRPENSKFPCNLVVFRAFERVPKCPSERASTASTTAAKSASAYPRFAATRISSSASSALRSAPGPLARRTARRPSPCARAKERRVVVLAHRRSLRFEHLRSARAAAQHCHHRVEVESAGGRGDQRLRDSHRVGRRHGVVDHLDRLAIAERSGMDDPGAHRRERAAAPRAKSPSAPPTMIVSVPSRAAGVEPVTGASTNRSPCPRSSPPIARAASRPIVEQSTHRSPSPAP